MSARKCGELRNEMKRFSAAPVSEPTCPLPSPASDVASTFTAAQHARGHSSSGQGCRSLGCSFGAVWPASRGEQQPCAGSVPPVSTLPSSVPTPGTAATQPHTDVTLCTGIAATAAASNIASAILTGRGYAEHPDPVQPTATTPKEGTESLRIAPVASIPLQPAATPRAVETTFPQAPFRTVARPSIPEMVSPGERIRQLSGTRGERRAEVTKTTRDPMPDDAGRISAADAGMRAISAPKFVHNSETR